VSSPAGAKGKGAELRSVRRTAAMAAMGLEAEFAVIVDGAQTCRIKA